MDSSLAEPCTQRANTNLATCSKNKKHIYPVHNVNCPWCGEKTIHDSGFMKGIRRFLGD